MQSAGVRKLIKLMKR